MGKAGPLGLGMEHLIDADQPIMDAVVERAVEAGVEFFDMLYALRAWLEIAGGAFASVGRERLKLAAHMAWGPKGSSIGNVRDLRRCRALFEETLQVLRTDRVEVLFVHNVDSREEFESWVPEAVQTAETFRRQGKVRQIGFSTHTAEIALDAVRQGWVEWLMFRINMANHGTEGRAEMLAECGSRGVKVVAMKPFEGGRLLTTVENQRLEEETIDEKSQLQTRVTPVRCLHYALSQPGVTMVIPGVRNVEELEASLRYLDASEEEKRYGKALSRVQPERRGECVYCNHCLPCPADINIGRTNRLGDQAAFGVNDALRADYAALEVKASDCIQCGACETRCPFGVKVIEKMERTAKAFEDVEA